MSETDSNSPKVSSILIGIIIFIILLVSVCSLSEVIKTLGAPFLYIPRQLGVIDSVTKADLIVVDMNRSPDEIYFGKPGRYAAYAINYDILTTSDALMEAGAVPWLRLTSKSTNQEAEIVFVHRGILPFDSPLAKGRQILTFVIPEAGTYTAVHMTNPDKIYILPDYVTGKEKTLLFWYLLQILVILTPIALLIQKNRAKKKKKIDEIIGLKKNNGEDFWQKELNSQQKDGKDKRNESFWKHK